MRQATPSAPSAGLHAGYDRVTIVNSAQITDGTLNVNETVALADRQVPALLQQLRRVPARALSGAPC